MAERSTLRLVPVTLREANRFVAKVHRHHQPVRGCRFAVGVEAALLLVGVAIVGRPVGRGVGAGTAEVTRVATDGTKNACSMLYAASARAAVALGYDRIQSYTLASESGVSLRAAGWRLDGHVVGRPWRRAADDPTARQLLLTGGTRRTDQPTTDKVRWVKELR